MREVLVAVFDTVAKTDEAVHALESAKVPTASVRRYHKGDPALTGSTHVSTGTERLAQLLPADAGLRTNENANGGPMAGSRTHRHNIAGAVTQGILSNWYVCSTVRQTRGCDSTSRSVPVRLARLGPHGA